MYISKLHECVFNTWVSKALTLVQTYGIDIDMGSGASFNRYCKSHIYNHFKIAWREEVQNIDKNPILRSYKTYKSEFGMEPYLYLISNLRYRNALTRLRTSSHTLEIELFLKPLSVIVFAARATSQKTSFIFFWIV